MANEILLTDGVTTLDLDDNTAYKTRYGDISIGVPDEVVGYRVIQWGGWVRGADMDTIVSNQQALVKMLETARTYQERGFGRKVELQFTPPGGSNAVTLDVLGYAPGDRRLRTEFTPAAIQRPLLVGGHLPASLTLICRPLGRGSESEIVAATTVDNLDTDNYVTISSTNIVGDVPALARIWLENNDAGVVTYDGFRAGLFADLRGLAVAPQPVLDAESEVSFATGVSEVVDTACRGNTKVRVNLGISTYGLEFDGTAKITVADDAALTITSALNDEFTLECWIRIKKDSDFSPFYSRAPMGLITKWDHDSAEDESYALFLDDQRARPITRATGGASIRDMAYTHGGQRLDPAEWHHVAFVAQHTTGSNMSLHVYVDGKLDKFQASIANSNFLLKDSACSLLIGDFVSWSSTYSRYNNEAAVGFLGRICEVRISDTARYTAEFTPSTTQFSNDANTVLLLHCDDGSGATITDSSSNGLNGTVSGGYSWVSGYFDSAAQEAKRGTWAAPEVLFENYAGEYNVYARVYSSADDVDDIGFRCKWANGSWWTTDQKKVSAVSQWELVFLGRVKLPWFEVQEGWIDDDVFGSNTYRQFEFYSQHFDGTDILDIDYFLFLPVDQGFFASGRSANIGQGQGQVFSAVDQPALIAKTGTTYTATEFESGAEWEWTPPKLAAARNHYLVLSFDRANNQNVIDDTIDVTVRYVPQYKFLR